MFFVPHCCLSLFPPLSRPVLSAPVLFRLLLLLPFPTLPPVALWPLRPGVLKDLKTMGSISLFIFFITLLVLARQVSWKFDRTSSCCATPRLTSVFSFLQVLTSSHPSFYTFFLLSTVCCQRTGVPKASVLWIDSTTFSFHILTYCITGGWPWTCSLCLSVCVMIYSMCVNVIAAPKRSLDGSYFCIADARRWGSKALLQKEASWDQFARRLFSCRGQCFISSLEVFQGEPCEPKWQSLFNQGSSDVLTESICRKTLLQCCLILFLNSQLS